MSFSSDDWIKSPISCNYDFYLDQYKYACCTKQKGLETAITEIEEYYNQNKTDMKHIRCAFGKWLLVFCLMSFTGHIYAKQRYYCEVKGIEKELSSGLKIIFDFGTKASYNMWGDLSSKLKFVNENGEEIKFNSMVDAANYMVQRGWIFQQAYSSAYGGKPIIHWIFFKDADNIEEAKEGIMTKAEYQKTEKQ